MSRVSRQSSRVGISQNSTCGLGVILNETEPMRFAVVSWLPFLCAALRGASTPKRITGDDFDAVLAVGADAGVGIAHSGPRTVDVPNWQQLVRGAAPNVTWGSSARAFNRSSTSQKLNALVVEELVARRITGSAAKARRLSTATRGGHAAATG